MLDLFAFREFREGLAMMRDGEAEKAMALLRQASERDPENPYYLSYYGLSLAYAEGKWADAERLCHTAVCRGRRQAQLYLNLAEVYTASGRKMAAADTLGARFALHAGRHAVAERNRQACRPPAPGTEIPASRSRIEPRIWFSSPQYAELYPTTALAGRQRIRSLVSSFHSTYLLLCRAARASCERFHAADIMAAPCRLLPQSWSVGYLLRIRLQPGTRAAAAGSALAFSSRARADFLLCVLLSPATGSRVDWSRRAASGTGISGRDSAVRRGVAILVRTHAVLAEKRLAFAAAGRLDRIDRFGSTGFEFVAARDDFRLPGRLSCRSSARYRHFRPINPTACY